MASLCNKWSQSGYEEKRGLQYEIPCNIKFNATRVGVPFEIKRHGFLSNTIYPSIKANKIDNINIRSGIGNYEINRPGFNKSSIMARQIIDFDKLQALDIEMAGQKVQLSEATIQKLFEIDIPDNSDIKWIEEKNRLTGLYRRQGMSENQIIQELQINKPLGREQRTKKEMKNIATSNLNMANKLKEIKQEIDEGRGESQQQQAILTGQLALILNDTKEINKLTNVQLSNLGRELATLGVPTTHQRLGLSSRYVDNIYYNQNAGLINLLFYSKARESKDPANYNYNLIVKNFTANDKGLPAIKLTSAVSALGRKKPSTVFLDLERGGIITKGQLKEIAKRFPKGMDHPLFSIDESNR